MGLECPAEGKLESLPGVRSSKWSRGFGRCRRARSTDSKKSGVHWVAPSLYLQVRDDGTRSWLFRYMLQAKPYWHGLGPACDAGLQEAREKADELRVSVRRHVNAVGGGRRAMSSLARGAGLTETFIKGS